MRGKSISDWRRLARHRRLCVIRKRNREADAENYAGHDASDNIARCFATGSRVYNNTERCVNSGILAVTREVTRQILRILPNQPLPGY